MYPKFIEIKGKKYPIDTDYRTALACFKAIYDNSITDTERTIAIVVLLLGKDFPFDLIPDAIEKCAIYLRCGKKENQEESEIDMDYFQDRKYIVPSFSSCYQINIDEEKMHWWKFNDYIESFKEDDVLSRVRAIRSADAYEIKDLKERDKLLKAKKEVALIHRKTPDEIKADDLWDKLMRGEI